MKKFMKGIFGLVKRHKLLTLICFVAFVIVVVMFYIFFSVFIGNGGKYGDRLDGIEKVEVSKKDLNGVTSFLKEQDGVVEANLRIQGKIIYTNIVFSREVSLERAKEIAGSVLEKFDDDEIKFYDFGYFLTQVEQDGNEDKGFIITGSKSVASDVISWIKS